MERLPKRVSEWLNRKLESLGVDPASFDEMFEEHPSNPGINKKMEIRVTQSEKGFCRSVQELLFSEKEDFDLRKIDLVEGLEEVLPLLSGTQQKISALVSIRGVLEYYYANPHVLEIGVARDNAVIAAANLKRQRKADRLRKQMKVAG